MCTKSQYQSFQSPAWRNLCKICDIVGRDCQFVWPFFFPKKSCSSRFIFAPLTSVMRIMDDEATLTNINQHSTNINQPTLSNIDHMARSHKAAILQAAGKLRLPQVGQRMMMMMILTYIFSHVLTTHEHRDDRGCVRKLPGSCHRCQRREHQGWDWDGHGWTKAHAFPNLFHRFEWINILGGELQGTRVLIAIISHIWSFWSGFLSRWFSFKILNATKTGKPRLAFQHFTIKTRVLTCPCSRLPKVWPR